MIHAHDKIILQKEIDDFKKSIEEEVNKMQQQVKAFDIQLGKNKTKIQQ